MSNRASQAKALLGDDLYHRVRDSKVLVVGAGGIGCELLKNLVLVGFGNIEIIDLDTIDLSNLNRQFLFRKADIKKPKAIIAAAFAHNFNPGPGPSAQGDAAGVKIKARHGNIKEEENDVMWMKGFDMVLSALDNLDARRHVNKLCAAAGVPLIESGTQGYLGQVTPMMKDRTECFDCIPKDPPKTFPVCTIRATPSEPIHCIVWAKSYLFGKLFGEDDEASDETELEKAKADGEDAEEIDNLKKEGAAFRAVRRAMGEDDGAKRVFEKVFTEDINRLLSMEDMWKVPGRVKPVPLDYEAILNGTFPAPHGEEQTAQASGSKQNGTTQQANGGAQPSASTLRDQKELSLKDNLELFIDSCNRLSARTIAHPSVLLSFDKDDDDTLDFVLATANLRAIAYGIPTKTRFQVKEMAGNIIPAIATTNAIVAGFIVMRALNLLRKDWDACTNVFLRGDSAKPLGSFRTIPPRPTCGVCADVYIPFRCDPTKLTLGSFIDGVVRSWLGWETREDDDDEPIEVSIFEGQRVLADPDFNDNLQRTLADLGVTRGKMLTVTDEDEKFASVVFAIAELPSTSSDALYQLPDVVPTIPARYTPPKPPSPPPAVVGKRKRDAAEDGELGDSTKKHKGNAEGDEIEIDDDDIEIL